MMSFVWRLEERQLLVEHRPTCEAVLGMLTDETPIEEDVDMAADETNVASYVNMEAIVETNAFAHEKYDDASLANPLSGKISKQLNVTESEAAGSFEAADCGQNMRCCMK